MISLLELTLADGQMLDLPASSINLLEGLAATPNPNLPQAKAYLRYTLGQETGYALITEGFAEIEQKLPSEGRLRLTKESGDPIIVLARNVLARKSLSDGQAKCELTVMTSPDGAMTVYRLLETRDEVKQAMDDLLNLPILLDQQENEPKSKRAQKKG